MKHAEEPEGWREEHEKQRDQGTRKRSFTVVGDCTVQGKRQGETVELEFTSAAVDVLIQAGCIQEQSYTKALSGPYESVLDALLESVTDAQDLAGTDPAETRATRAQTTKKG